MTMPLGLTDTQHQALREHLRQLLPGIPVWAYGSRVNGTARANSDLDLVAFAPAGQGALVRAAREALDESNLPYLVDLHSWDELPARFHNNIRGCHLVIQEGVRDLAPPGPLPAD